MLTVIDVARIQKDVGRLRMERKSETIQEDWTMDGEDIFYPLQLQVRTSIPEFYTVRKSMIKFPTWGYAHYLTDYFHGGKLQ